jgi:putative ATPase
VDLFTFQARQAAGANAPLADRMRPLTLGELEGQQRIAGPDSALARAIAEDRLFSMILWGPPGCGKTSLARIIARETRAHFVQVSAVLAGVKEIRAVVAEAEEQLRMQRRRTILFVDEIHRFNKAQQDAFLPHVESGLITLIGATTENPSFEVVPALISRCRVLVLEPLSPEAMARILERALADPQRGLGKLGLALAPDALAHLVELADGDVRVALNNLEATAALQPPACAVITLEQLAAAINRKAPRYDKGGEEHYNQISAFHKSLRGSDPDAALYWLARMLAGGEDPFYILRRMARFAAEDIGNADPQALALTIAARDAYHFLGSPEGELAIAQATLYLATAPKSNATYVAFGQARETATRGGSLPVPLHIRNAPTRLMADLGYGQGYQYAHDHPEAFVPQDYLPEALHGRIFYHPTERGYERQIKARLERWRQLRQGATRASPSKPEPEAPQR